MFIIKYHNDAQFPYRLQMYIRKHPNGLLCRRI